MSDHLHERVGFDSAGRAKSPALEDGANRRARASVTGAQRFCLDDLGDNRSWARWLRSRLRMRVAIRGKIMFGNDQIDRMDHYLR